MCDRASVKILNFTQLRDVFYSTIKKKRMASKINDGAENRLNDYQQPSGIGIKKGCIN
jgi:hypothetical protein